MVSFFNFFTLSEYRWKLHHRKDSFLFIARFNKIDYVEREFNRITEAS